MDIRIEIESWLPNIAGKPFSIFKSSPKFNCVAFSLDIYDYWLWTNEIEWPYQEIPRNSGLDGFRKLYNMHGYSECVSDIFEEGFDKIAFYSKGNIPQHGCKQFGDMWRSKLGNNVIIEHKLEWLCGDSEYSYGEVEFIMKRPK